MHQAPPLAITVDEFIASYTPTYATADTDAYLAEFVIIDKLGRRWDPLKHPRDSKGRFIETFAELRLLLRTKSGSVGSKHYATGKYIATDQTGKMLVQITHTSPGATGPNGKPLKVRDLVSVDPKETDSMPDVKARLGKKPLRSSTPQERDSLRAMVDRVRNSRDRDTLSKIAEGTSPLSTPEQIAQMRKIISNVEDDNNDKEVIGRLRQISADMSGDDSTPINERNRIAEQLIAQWDAQGLIAADNDNVTQPNRDSDTPTGADDDFIPAPDVTPPPVRVEARPKAKTQPEPEPAPEPPAGITDADRAEIDRLTQEYDTTRRNKPTSITNPLQAAKDAIEAGDIDAAKAHLKQAQDSEKKYLERQERKKAATPAPTPDPDPTPTPEPEPTPEPTPDMTPLPRGLAGAKPRYSQKTLNFENDMGKALMIVAQDKPSKRDADYMAWLKERLPGMSESQIRALGARWKKEVIGPQINKDPDPRGPGTVNIPAFVLPKEATPATPKNNRALTKKQKEQLEELRTSDDPEVQDLVRQIDEAVEAKDNATARDLLQQAQERQDNREPEPTPEPSPEGELSPDELDEIESLRESDDPVVQDLVDEIDAAIDDDDADTARDLLQQAQERVEDSETDAPDAPEPTSPPTPTPTPTPDETDSGPDNDTAEDEESDTDAEKPEKSQPKEVIKKEDYTDDNVYFDPLREQLTDSQKKILFLQKLRKSGKTWLARWPKEFQDAARKWSNQEPLTQKEVDILNKYLRPPSPEAWGAYRKLISGRGNKLTQEEFDAYNAEIKGKENETLFAWTTKMYMDRFEKSSPEAQERARQSGQPIRDHAAQAHSALWQKWNAFQYRLGVQNGDIAADEEPPPGVIPSPHVDPGAEPGIGPDGGPGRPGRPGRPGKPPIGPGTGNRPTPPIDPFVDDPLIINPNKTGTPYIYLSESQRFFDPSSRFAHERAAARAEDRRRELYRKWARQRQAESERLWRIRNGLEFDHSYKRSSREWGEFWGALGDFFRNAGDGAIMWSAEKKGYGGGLWVDPDPEFPDPPEIVTRLQNNLQELSNILSGDEEFSPEDAIAKMKQIRQSLQDIKDDDDGERPEGFPDNNAMDQFIAMADEGIALAEAILKDVDDPEVVNLLDEINAKDNIAEDIEIDDDEVGTPSDKAVEDGYEQALEAGVSSSSTEVQQAKAKVNRIGQTLVMQKKQAIANGNIKRARAIDDVINTAIRSRDPRTARYNLQSSSDLDGKRGLLPIVDALEELFDTIGDLPYDPKESNKPKTQTPKDLPPTPTRPRTPKPPVTGEPTGEGTFEEVNPTQWAQLDRNDLFHKTLQQMVNRRVSEGRIAEDAAIAQVTRNALIQTRRIWGSRLSQGKPPRRVLQDKERDITVLLDGGNVGESRMEAVMENAQRLHDQDPAAGPFVIVIRPQEDTDQTSKSTIGFTFFGANAIVLRPDLVNAPPGSAAEGRMRGTKKHFFPGSDQQDLLYGIMAHELGHIRGTTLKDEFKKGTELNSLLTDVMPSLGIYGRKNAMEAYAESYAMWVTSQGAPESRVSMTDQGLAALRKLADSEGWPYSKAMTPRAVGVPDDPETARRIKEIQDKEIQRDKDRKNARRYIKRNVSSVPGIRRIVDKYAQGDRKQYLNDRMDEFDSGDFRRTSFLISELAEMLSDHITADQLSQMFREHSPDYNTVSRRREFVHSLSDMRKLHTGSSTTPVELSEKYQNFLDTLTVAAARQNLSLLDRNNLSEQDRNTLTPGVWQAVEWQLQDLLEEFDNSGYEDPEVLVNLPDLIKELYGDYLDIPANQQQAMDTINELTNNEPWQRLNDLALNDDVPFYQVVDSLFHNPLYLNKRASFFTGEETDSVPFQGPRETNPTNPGSYNPATNTISFDLPPEVLEQAQKWLDEQQVRVRGEDRTDVRRGIGVEELSDRVFADSTGTEVRALDFVTVNPPKPLSRRYADDPDNPKGPKYHLPRGAVGRLERVFNKKVTSKLVDPVSGEVTSVESSYSYGTFRHFDTKYIGGPSADKAEREAGVRWENPWWDYDINLTENATVIPQSDSRARAVLEEYKAHSRRHAFRGAGRTSQEMARMFYLGRMLRQDLIANRFLEDRNGTAVGVGDLVTWKGKSWQVTWVDTPMGNKGRPRLKVIDAVNGGSVKMATASQVEFDRAGTGTQYFRSSGGIAVPQASELVLALSGVPVEAQDAVDAAQELARDFTPDNLQRMVSALNANQDLLDFLDDEHAKRVDLADRLSKDPSSVVASDIESAAQDKWLSSVIRAGLNGLIRNEQGRLPTKEDRADLVSGVWDNYQGEDVQIRLSIAWATSRKDALARLKASPDKSLSSRVRVAISDMETNDIRDPEGLALIVRGMDELQAMGVDMSDVRYRLDNFLNAYNLRNNKNIQPGDLPPGSARREISGVLPPTPEAPLEDRPKTDIGDDAEWYNASRARAVRRAQEQGTDEELAGQTRAVGVDDQGWVQLTGVWFKGGQDNDNVRGWVKYLGPAESEDRDRAYHHITQVGPRSFRISTFNTSDKYGQSLFGKKFRTLDEARAAIAEGDARKESEAVKREEQRKHTQTEHQVTMPDGAVAYVQSTPGQFKTVLMGQFRDEEGNESWHAISWHRSAKRAEDQEKKLRSEAAAGLRPEGELISVKFGKPEPSSRKTPLPRRSLAAETPEETSELNPNVPADDATALKSSLRDDVDGTSLMASVDQFYSQMEKFRDEAQGYDVMSAGQRESLRNRMEEFWDRNIIPWLANEYATSRSQDDSWYPRFTMEWADMFDSVESTQTTYDLNDLVLEANLNDPDGGGFDPSEISPGVQKTQNINNQRDINDGTQWANLTASVRKKLEDELAEYGGTLGMPTSGKNKLTIDTMVDNILDAIGTSTEREMEYALKWYPRARETADELARKHGVSPRIATMVLASLSPKTKWNANIATADLVLRELNPETSSLVNKDFLDTVVTVRLTEPKLDASGRIVKKKNPKTENMEDVMESVVRTLTPRQYIQEQFWFKKRYAHLTDEEGNNPLLPDEGVRIAQFRDPQMRASLIRLANAVYNANNHPDRDKFGKPIVGDRGQETSKIYVTPNVEYQDSNSEGDPLGKMKGTPAPMNTHYPAINIGFGYDAVDFDAGNSRFDGDLDDLFLPDDNGGWHPWNLAPDNEDDRRAAELNVISRGLGGHKTRSFFNNIITGGRSLNSVTVDTHALDTLILGAEASRTGNKAPGGEKFLATKGGSESSEGRSGSYALFHEAFRRATDQINEARRAQGKDPITMAQVQSIAWIGTLKSSESAAIANAVRDNGDVFSKFNDWVADGEGLTGKTARADRGLTNNQFNEIMEILDKVSGIRSRRAAINDYLGKKSKKKHFTENDMRKFLELLEDNTLDDDALMRDEETLSGLLSRINASRSTRNASPLTMQELIDYIRHRRGGSKAVSLVASLTPTHQGDLEKMYQTFLSEIGDLSHV